MALVRHSPWPTSAGSSLSDLFNDDRLFNSPWFREQNMPAVNVKETERAFEVELAAPGFSKKDFHISVDEGMLTVSAESKHDTEKKDDNYTRREFGYSSFSRSFNLPTNTNEEDIQAKYEEGVLKLSIAKKNVAAAKPKKSIQIK
ncbi:MAG TPA: Hsp20/alpha crystallin family protein [Chryseolinea sp.]